jgi:hypothetical protein
VDVETEKVLKHELECMQAAYARLVEKARQAGRTSDAIRLDAEWKKAEQEIITAFWRRG